MNRLVRTMKRICILCKIIYDDQLGQNQLASSLNWQLISSACVHNWDIVSSVSFNIVSILINQPCMNPELQSFRCRLRIMKQVLISASATTLQSL